MSNGHYRMISEKLSLLSQDLAHVHEPEFLRRVHPVTTASEWYVMLYPALCLRGNVSGHPHLEDGPFESSRLYYINEDLRLARPLSRWYQLGTPMSSARRGQ